MNTFHLVMLDTDPDTRIPKNERALVMTFRTELTTSAEAEAAARDAVAGFLSSKEGEKALAVNCGHFNWGDAAVSLPGAAWERHGLQFVGFADGDILVYHNENLTEDN